MMMKDLPEKGYQRVLVLLVYGLLFAAAAALFFCVLWKPVLPFLLAALFGAALQKPLGALDRLTGGRRGMRRVWAALLVLLCTGTLTGLLCILGSRLLTECRSILAWIGDSIGDMGQRLDAILWDIRGFVTSLPGSASPETAAQLRDGIFFRFLESADGLLVSMLQNAVSALTAKLPALLASFLAALPQIVLFFTVFLIAAVSFAADWKQIGAWLTERFPDRAPALLSGLRSSLASALLLYGRAYLILMLLTFTELYLGFLILGVPYAFGTAALTAIIDLLPVLGTGTVLIPWALFAFFEGRGLFGTGLLLLYAVVCIVRQIAEPRIVGKHIGLHPLAALFSMYAGFRLFGVAGLFLAPMGTAAVIRFSGRRLRQKGNSA